MSPQVSVGDLNQQAQRRNELNRKLLLPLKAGEKKQPSDRQNLSLARTKLRVLQGEELL